MSAFDHILERSICGSSGAYNSYSQRYSVSEYQDSLTIYGTFLSPWDLLIYALADSSYNWEFFLAKYWSHGGVSCACHLYQGQICRFYVAENLEEYEDITIPTVTFQSILTP